jgi:hypothetical protein
VVTDTDLTPRRDRPAMPGPQTPPQQTHHTWCRQHQPEGCLSAQAQIPDLPVTIWATTGDTDGTVEIIIDGPYGTQVIPIRT